MAPLLQCRAEGLADSDNNSVASCTVHASLDMIGPADYINCGPHTWNPVL